MRWHQKSKLETNNEQSDRTPCIRIFESEARLIAGNAVAWGQIETGGGMYGFWTHGLNPVVFLVTPPGPGAIHEVANFAQDVEVFKCWTRYLSEAFGIQFLGDWHSHHSLGIDHPSPGDCKHIGSIASRNSIPRMAEIIVTHHSDCHPPPSHGYRHNIPHRHGSGLTALCRRSFPSAQPEQGVPFPDSSDRKEVRIHAFVFPDAAQGTYLKCPVNILPGCSPLRCTLACHEVLRPIETGFPDPPYPLGKIAFDTAEKPIPDDSSRQNIPPDLLDQIHILPESILENTEVYDEGGIFAVSLLLPEGAKALLNYDVQADLISVYLLHRNSKEPVDITAHLGLNPAPELREVYRQIYFYFREVQAKKEYRLQNKQETYRATGQDGHPGSRLRRGAKTNPPKTSRQAESLDWEGSNDWRI